MTAHSATARARSLIEVMRHSLGAGFADRNKETADRYIASIYDAGLIERNQFEDLKVEAELALTGWSMKSGLNNHFCSRA